MFSARRVKSWRPVALRCNLFGVKCTEFSEACNPYSTSYEKLEITEKFVTSKTVMHPSDTVAATVCTMSSNVNKAAEMSGRSRIYFR